MRKALRYRLFGMGKMPDSLRAAAGGAGVRVAAEGLTVHNRVQSLRMPGAKVSSGVRMASGSVVMVPGRLLASIGKYVILDTEFPADGGKQELGLAEDGLRISFDVSTVLSKGSGSVEVHYKLPLDQSVLGQLPVRGCQVRLAHAAEALSTRGAVRTRVADQGPCRASYPVPVKNWTQRPGKSGRVLGPATRAHAVNSR